MHLTKHTRAVIAAATLGLAAWTGLGIANADLPVVGEISVPGYGLVIPAEGEPISQKDIDVARNAVFDSPAEVAAQVEADRAEEARIAAGLAPVPNTAGDDTEAVVRRQVIENLEREQRVYYGTDLPADYRSVLADVYAADELATQITGAVQAVEFWKTDTDRDPAYDDYRLEVAEWHKTDVDDDEALVEFSGRDGHHQSDGWKYQDGRWLVRLKLEGDRWKMTYQTIERSSPRQR